MNNSFALMTAIAEYADGMRAAGRVVDANHAALVLSTKYPRSGMTMAEIVRQIERASAMAGAALFSSSTGVEPALQRERETAPEFDAYLSASEKEQFS